MISVHKKTQFIVILVFTLMVIPLWASSVWTDLDNIHKTEPAGQLSLQMLANQYFTSPTLEEQSSRYQYVLPRFNWESNNDSGNQYTTDFRAVLPLSREGEAHFFFPEVFWGYRTSIDGPSISFGRRLFDWSMLDRSLGLGIWQPLFRWDHARPDEMGLTGLFLQTGKKGPIRITLLLSPIFLPDQQPDYQISDGNIVSGNRWFRPPITTVSVGKSFSELHYEVYEPEVKDVVWNEVYAINMQAGYETGPFFQASWADKPMNQFHLGIDTSQSLRTDLGNILEPRVYPVLVRHQIWTIEAGIKNNDYKFFVSYTGEKVGDSNTPDNWEQTPLTEGSYQGIGIEHRVPFSIFKDSTFQWVFAHREEDSAIHTVSSLDGPIDSSTQRIEIQDWGMLKWNTNKYLGDGQLLRSTIAFNYSLVDSGQWLSFDMNLQMGPKWSWYVSGDILGASDNVQVENESFISQYKNNDRLQGGFVYVF